VIKSNKVRKPLIRLTSILDMSTPESEEDWASFLNALSEIYIKAQSDLVAAATEFRVSVPKPGTEMAKLLLDAKSARQRAAALETENILLLSMIDELREEIDSASK
jgi:hypothetical protein